MAGLSKYLALGLFNSTLNPVREPLVPPTGLYLALHTAAPSDATYGTEATYGSYARQALNSLTAELAAETAGGDVDAVVTNGSALVFPASTGTAAQTVTHWAIWDSATKGDGNILYSGPIGSSRLIAVGDSVVVPEGSLVLTLK
jgi:hypothetical protein